LGKNLFVGNLAFSVTDFELQALFEKVGPVVTAKVVVDRETRRSRGFGFVEMGDEESSAEAIARLNGTESFGRRITVNEAMVRPAPSAGGVNRAGAYGATPDRR